MLRCFTFSDPLCVAGHQDCWRWLQGDFHFVQIVDRLCNAMSEGKWQGWLSSNPLNVHLMNQLIAHCVPIDQQQSVPGSTAAGATVTWQDLENDGIAYIGEPGMQPVLLLLPSGYHCWMCCLSALAPDLPKASAKILPSWRVGPTLQPFASSMHRADCRSMLGQGLGSDDSGDSLSSGGIQAAIAAASGPDSEGWLYPDREPHLVSMPPVLLVAAHRSMTALSNKLLWLPLLKHLSDDWQKRELTDVSVLVAKLFFWRHVLCQPVVSLRELLGGADIGVHEMSFCVPNNNFCVCDVSSQLTDPAELQSMVSNMDAQWAFRGPGSFGPDSWLLLRRPDDAADSGLNPIVAVCVQSKKCQAASSMRAAKPAEEAQKMLYIPGVDNLVIYATDERRPICHQHESNNVVPTSMVVVGKNCLPAYYSACIALLISAQVSCLSTGSVLEMLNITMPNTCFNNCILQGVLIQDYRCIKTMGMHKVRWFCHFQNTL